MASFKIDISAAAVDAALTNEVIRVSTLSVGSAINTAIFAADSGSGADVWASSDQAGTSQIGLKLVYWSDGDSKFAVDIAASSLSALSGGTVYLQVGSKPGNVDPYPATAELSMPMMADFDDDTSNGNDGTAFGGVTAGGVTGPDGVLPATDFNGTQGLEIGGSPLNISGQIALSAWVYASATASTVRVVSHWGGLPDRRQYLLELAIGRPRFARSNQFNLALLAAASAVSANTWTHMAGVYDGSGHQLYVNGSLVGSDAKTFTAISTTGLVGIAAEGHGERSANLTGRVAGAEIESLFRSAASIKLEYLLTGPNAATYITATDVSFNPAWAAYANQRAA